MNSLSAAYGLAFHQLCRAHFVDPQELVIRQGDRVVAETLVGLEVGLVVRGPLPLPLERLSSHVKAVLRVATAEDLAQVAANLDRECEALETCRTRVAEHELPMDLVSASYTLDKSHLTFYFTSEERVDFRELVKDLASTFQARVHLNQIGVRDEAGWCNGCGPCGRPLCCSSFLHTFAPVSVRMAKEQELSLNPTKISGLCGRLMCCLRYEYDLYCEEGRDVPKTGSTVQTPRGLGKVIERNVLRKCVRIRFPEDQGCAVFQAAETQPVRRQPPEPQPEASAGAKRRKRRRRKASQPAE